MINILLKYPRAYRHWRTGGFLFTCRSKINPNFDFHMCVTPNCKATMNSSPESQYTLIIYTFKFKLINIKKDSISVCVVYFVKDSTNNVLFYSEAFHRSRKGLTIRIRYFNRGFGFWIQNGLKNWADFGLPTLVINKIKFKVTWMFPYGRWVSDTHSIYWFSD